MLLSTRHPKDESKRENRQLTRENAKIDQLRRFQVADAQAGLVYKGMFIAPSVRDGLVRKSEALAQNPNYRGVIELPTPVARREAQQVLRQLGITNISTRVRP
jgi:hypothetical protein